MQRAGLTLHRQRQKLTFAGNSRPEQAMTVKKRRATRTETHGQLPWYARIADHNNLHLSCIDTDEPLVYLRI